MLNRHPTVSSLLKWVHYFPTVWKIGNALVSSCIFESKVQHPPQVWGCYTQAFTRINNTKIQNVWLQNAHIKTLDTGHNSNLRRTHGKTILHKCRNRAMGGFRMYFRVLVGLLEAPLQMLAPHLRKLQLPNYPNWSLIPCHLLSLRSVCQ